MSTENKATTPQAPELDDRKPGDRLASDGASKRDLATDRDLLSKEEDMKMTDGMLDAGQIKEEKQRDLNKKTLDKQQSLKVSVKGLPDGQGKIRLGDAAEEKKAPAKAGKTPPQPKVGYRDLYKYSSQWDQFVFWLGMFFSLAGGCVMPAYGIVIGKIVESFKPTLETDDQQGILRDFIPIIAVICVLTYVTTWLGYSLMQISSERLSFKLRAKYLASLMKQEVEYFEKQQVESMPSKIAEYFTHIAEGSGEKTGQLVSTLGATCSGIIIGLSVCPYYSLALCIYMPFATILMRKFQAVIISGVMKKFGMNHKIGGFTEEMLSSLKLIISFGQEDFKFKQYEKMAQESYLVAKKSSIQIGAMGGCFFGLILGFSWFSWSVGYIFIKYEVWNPRYGRITTVYDLVACYQALMFAMFTVIAIQGLVPSVYRALSVGYDVIAVIDRLPQIRSPDDQNKRVTSIDIQDGIKFNQISFRYPTAPDTAKDVFTGASFTIQSNTSTAIVGPSGSGKSTVVQMLNRFYDPKEGSVTYGSTALKDIDLPTLREKIGWVGQEPVLIVGTIRENIMYGNKEATEQQLQAAIKDASAGFIDSMEKGLDTYVGSSTVLNLSGGQKQRIAIARALIKNPQILVLDEATSALDPKSEGEVQAAILKLQEEQKEMTIIMIAHRLQTIASAQNLLYLESSSSVLSGKKGSQEYTEIMDRLKKTSYAHQVQDIAQLDDDANDNEKDDANVQLYDGNLSQASHYSVHSMQMDAEGKRESQKISKAIRRASIQNPPAKIQLDVKQEDEEKDKIKLTSKFISSNAGWGRIFQYYKPSYIIVAMVVLASINSFAMPVIAYIIIQLQFALFKKESEPDSDWESDVHILLIIQGCWLVCIICVGGTEKALFAVMGEKLTLKLRLMLIKEIMHKQISWFDREDRAPGILTNVISADITQLNGMTSEVLVTIFELAAVVCLGLIGGIYFCWQAAVLCFVCSPIMIFGTYMMLTMQWGQKGGKNKALTEGGVDEFEKSNALLSDVILNYRTVQSFGQKNIDEINKNFEALLEGPMQDIIKKSNRAGMYYGLGQAGRTLFISMVFILGMELLVVKWGIDSTEVFTASYLLFFTYMSVGAQAANVPSIQKAKASAIPVFSIIDEISTLDIRKPVDGAIKTVEKGKIEFKGVNFNYPTRAQKVMKNFNLEIPAGAKIALVGHSGCGKSTLTNILLRFYNINQGEGKVLIDGKELEQYDVHALRQQCGYVMQEPVLFNTDIKENILFGKPDATDKEVYIAAQNANALQFIETDLEDLPEDEKLAKLNENLQQAFETCGQPAVAALFLQFQDCEKEIKQLILDLLNNCKSKRELLQLANDHIDDFNRAISITIKKFGASWADVVMHFEWRDELDTMYNSSELSERCKDIIRACLDKNPDLHGCFNYKTVSEYGSQAKSGDEFALIVRDQLSSFKIKVVNKRYQELQYQAIEGKGQDGGEFALHEGFKKVCGLKGGKLSGGQKQRIAIARALIKDPRILILDEATSALDEQSQEIVQQALDRAMEGRTSIVIAHRLSTVRNCDILFVLGDGHVLEYGSYDDLANDPSSHFNVLKAGMEN